MITKTLEEIQHILNTNTLATGQIFLLFPFKVWKAARESGIALAKFSDEELNAALQDKDGYIGVSKNIDCYIEKQNSTL